MEELDFQGLLGQFNAKGLERGEQVILGHFGTVQTLLSLIFKEPVTVKLLEQETRDNESAGEILRSVQLVCGVGVVCNATTHIPLEGNRPDVLADISAGTLGLGQIVVVRAIPNKRVLVDVGRNAHAFWRKYTIEGPELLLQIHEYFPRDPFEEVGWLQAGGGFDG
ncbi:hypothetical protein LCGC14_1854900 [marine sediment metagenome]|uniref:Uncharacterized protein n=1 Tax=marine sediment metagenome TaxID=412755 RepID=A0A0F9G9P9_9ZZZZ